MNITDYSLVRMFSTEIGDITEHLCGLSPEDKYLRFGYTPSDTQIFSYVATTINTINTKEKSDFWFAVMDCDVVAATLHVAIRDGSSEFAFTTHISYRGQKLGQLLFARGYQLVTEFKISKIYLNCLTKNAAMRHIAKKFGFSVMTYGSDSEASVNIQYPVPLSRIDEVKMVMIDKGLFLK